MNILKLSLLIPGFKGRHSDLIVASTLMRSVSEFSESVLEKLDKLGPCDDNLLINENRSNIRRELNGLGAVLTSIFIPRIFVWNLATR